MHSNCCENLSPTTDNSIYTHNPRVKELIDELGKSMMAFHEQLNSMKEATEIDHITLECDYMETDLPIMLQDVNNLRDFVVKPNTIA